MQAGPGTREDVVLIHGMGSGPIVWAGVVGALEATHRVHVLTLAGHLGGARLRENRESLGELLVDEVEADLDRLGLTRPHVVGNSLGGWIALRLGERGRARSVTCLAPAGGWEPGGLRDRGLALLFTLVRALCRLILAVAPAVLRVRFVRRQLMGSACVRPDALPLGTVEAMVRDLAGCDALEGIVRHPRRHHLSRIGVISCPTTLAWSDRDRLLAGPGARVRFAPLAGELTEVELAGLGHVPMLDDPGQIARLVASSVRNAMDPQTDIV
jgi:pimeloyl-ACP methyl ester carboxylesterase